MPNIKDIWLYANNVIRSSRQFLNEGLRLLNLSSAEGNILMHLFTKRSGIKQEDIVAQLDISKPAVSRAIASLKKKGYVKSYKDSMDKRVRRIFLTQKASRIKAEVERIYDEIYVIAAEGVSEEEADSFIELFGRISRNFSRASRKQKT
ncbi:MAG: MarR family transcriptional regulator [Firmicutes bacterium]|nr:MarR family transcriptional regulator [Bacillota bacterium]